MCSDNLPGAVNQQERLDHRSRILRDHTPNIRSDPGEDMVRPAWRHAEPGRNVLAPVPLPEGGGNKSVGPYPSQP